jgi:preprotein translocase subunit SecE
MFLILFFKKIYRELSVIVWPTSGEMEKTLGAFFSGLVGCVLLVGSLNFFWSKIMGWIYVRFC